MKNRAIIIVTVSFLGLFGLIEPSQAATLYMPDNCASFSACVSTMKSGDTLVIRDGIYSHATTGVRANTTIQADNDGKVIFTGSFNPGNAGFTMRGLVVRSSGEKSLGAGNNYNRMSFVGGPTCGNTVNTYTGSGTTITESAFYGEGGRYLFLAYYSDNVTLTDVIFRKDGGWGQGSSSCTEWEPEADYNMYDSEGISITRVIVFDSISTAHKSAEYLGAHVVNTHSSHGDVGTISQSVTTGCEDGRFSSEGNGSHSVTIIDCVAKANGYSSVSRNVNGTTTATRFDTDGSVDEWQGTINRTSGANLALNTAFLNDPRWKQEMCSDAGVTRGFCNTSMNLGSYVANKLGITEGGSTPADPPTNLHVISD
jgi:hypothetical protein